MAQKYAKKTAATSPGGGSALEEMPTIDAIQSMEDMLNDLSSLTEQADRAVDRLYEARRNRVGGCGCG